MIIVPPQDLANVWPRVAGWIEAAIEEGQGDENALDVLIALARGQYLLWYEADKFAAVVQILKQPRQTVATVVYCGGSGLDDMRAAFHEGTLWAKANGIQAVRAYGRAGWARAMGFETVGVILQKAL